MTIISLPRMFSVTPRVIFSAFEGLLMTLAFGIFQVHVAIETNQLTAGLIRSQLGWPFPWREVWSWSKCEGIDCVSVFPQFGIGIVNWTFLLFDFLIFTALVFFTMFIYQNLTRKRPST